MMETTSNSAVERVRIGKYVTLRDESNAGAKYLVAHPIAYDALARELGDRDAVVTINSELGRAIFNRRAGEHRTYRNKRGEQVSVWIVLIESLK
jgi:transcription elongation GreA/GreB family factor